MDLSLLLSRAQATAESLMTDACAVTRSTGDPVLNEETGQYESPTVTTLYDGKCRIRSKDAMGSQRQGGEQFAIVNRVAVSIPAGLSGFATGDMVTITASVNPQLVNARYVVRSVDDNSHASALRLECEET